MGKRAEDLKAGDKVKVDGEKLTVEKVRDEGEEIRLILVRPGSRIQESFDRGERL